jgi:hemerythrin
VEFLNVWLLDHIEHQDRKMIDFMRQKGASAK